MAETNEVAVCQPAQLTELPKPEMERLISELDAMIGERTWEQRIDQCRLKWEVGEEIVKTCDKNGLKEYNTVLKKVRNALKVSESELYRCCKFYQKFSLESWDDVVAALPGGKNITWSKLRKLYLPELPVGRLKLEFPAIEIQDQWNLIKWFLSHANTDVSVVIKDAKRPGVSLKLSAVKDEISDTPLKQALEQVRRSYLDLKGWKEADLDSNDYARLHRAIKALLVKAKGEVKSVLRGIKWVSEQSYMDWSLETVEKKWPEIRKQQEAESHKRVENRDWMPTQKEIEEREEREKNPEAQKKISEMLKGAIKSVPCQE